LIWEITQQVDNLSWDSLGIAEPANRHRLRSVVELFPELIEPSLDDDGYPSCSAAEALERQEPFVNPTLANRALALLARLFRHGSIAYHGAFVNIAGCRVQPLPVNPKLWRGMRRRGLKGDKRIVVLTWLSERQTASRREVYPHLAIYPKVRDGDNRQHGQ